MGAAVSYFSLDFVLHRTEPLCATSSVQVAFIPSVNLVLCSCSWLCCPLVFASLLQLLVCLFIRFFFRCELSIAYFYSDSGFLGVLARGKFFFFLGRGPCGCSVEDVLISTFYMSHMLLPGFYIFGNFVDALQHTSL